MVLTVPQFFQQTGAERNPLYDFCGLSVPVLIKIPVWSTKQNM